MGTVHAKDLDHGHGHHHHHDKSYTTAVDLQEIPVKVSHVHVDGLGRTKDDLAIQEVREVLLADNFKDMVKRANRAKSRLERLGIFSSVGIFIDTNKESKNGYDVTFEVTEMKNVIGGVNTLVGTNDASLMFNLRSPNVFGRAEKFNAEYTHGTKHSSGFSVDFTKPFEKNPDTKLQTRAFQYAGDCPWSSYRQKDKGLSAHLAFKSAIGDHGLRWEGVWRELEALTNSTAFAVREELGHSLISTIKHSFVRDRRDNPVLPETGTLIRLTQEYAGLGGDAEFVKHDAEFQISHRMMLDTVLQFSLSAGIMKPLNPERPIKICDKFFLGGPLTLRGFQMRGAGEHSDGDALGGLSYWSAGAHLYTPLPFRPGRGGFGDMFRTHLFVNAGGLGSLDLNDSAHQNLLSAHQSMRLSYGGGLVFRFGRIARMELNYCVPLRAEPGDKLNTGVQFGIGVAFL